jgi:hypothetical protein
LTKHKNPYSSIRLHIVTKKNLQKIPEHVVNGLIAANSLNFNGPDLQWERMD